MNWEEFVQVVSELIKDKDIRRQIYDRMLETCEINDSDILLGMDIDPVFDDIAQDYVDLEEEEFEEDEDYEIDEDYEYDDES